MLTYQDWEKVKDTGEMLEFISKAIREHRTSDDCKIACSADNYDKQQNEFILDFTDRWFDKKQTETTQTALCNNLYHRLNTQRCTYSLGNGISFSTEGDG